MCEAPFLERRHQQRTCAPQASLQGGQEVNMSYDAWKSEEPQSPWDQIQLLKASMRRLEQASVSTGLDFVAKRRQLDRAIAQLERQLEQEDAERIQAG
jgi:hypothetical protein